MAEAILAERRQTSLRAIDIDAIVLDSYSFTLEKIKLDLDPREIRNSQQFAKLGTPYPASSREL